MVVVLSTAQSTAGVRPQHAMLELERFVPYKRVLKLSFMRGGEVQLFPREPLTEGRVGKNAGVVFPTVRPHINVPKTVIGVRYRHENTAERCLVVSVQ